MAKLFWHNLLQLIHEIRKLPLSRTQVWSRMFKEATHESQKTDG